MSKEEECGLGRASFFSVAVGATTGEEVSSLVAFPNNLEDRGRTLRRRIERCLRPRGRQVSLREDITLKKLRGINRLTHTRQKVLLCVERDVVLMRNSHN